VVAITNQKFDVVGTHTYGSSGEFVAAVQITDSGGSQASVTSAIKVSGTHLIVTGADAGGGPEVRVFTPTGTLLRDFMAYNPAFAGGVRVALGDVDGDGDEDIVTAPGAGGGPDIRVFDGSSGALIAEFMAFSPLFSGGVFIAVADINHDGFADIITSAGKGGGPEVKVFDGKSIMARAPALLADFMAYDPAFNGGVQVAAGDINRDGIPDLITAPGAGGGPDVRVFGGADLSGASSSTDIIREFMAYSPLFAGGVFVAATDVNGDGYADVITGAGAGGGPEVKATSGRDGSILADFMAYNSSFSGGVRVAAVGDLNGDGGAELVTTPGAGISSSVQVFDGPGANKLDTFFAYDPKFLGGVFVGGQ
jgi:hypothetical protein